MPKRTRTGAKAAPAKTPARGKKNATPSAAGLKGGTLAPDSSVEALLAHALEIERESVKRYAELSGRMAQLGDERLSGLFQMLARFEQGHASVLASRTAKMKLPDVSGQHKWKGTEALGAPRSTKLTPRKALELAFEAEQRAKAFYESLHKATRDAKIRELAKDFAAEEQIHMETVQYALERLPDPAGGES